MVTGLSSEFTSLSQAVFLQYGTDDIEADSASLWFAGKMMIPENKLSVHTGRHENTKAIVKLQKKGQGAPSREPVSSSEMPSVHLMCAVADVFQFTGGGPGDTTGNVGMV